MSPSDLDATSATLFWIIVLPIIYFIPSIAGWHKKGAAGIFVVNLFLGWTLIGWVIALAWACAAPQKPEV
jgi:hypothetical protein